MKRFLLLLPLLLLSLLPSFAAQPRRAVFVEFGGLGNSAAVFYDARISSTSKFGYSLGLSYGGDTTPFDSPFTRNHYLYNGGAVALEINQLFGKKRHFFDLGFGTSFGFYQRKGYSSGWGNEYVYDTNTRSVAVPEPSQPDLPSEEVVFKFSSSDESTTRFGAFVSVRASYRYQAPRGLFFRVGLACLFPTGIVGSGSATENPVFAPHLGVGLSF